MVLIIWLTCYNHFFNDRIYIYNVKDNFTPKVIRIQTPRTKWSQSQDVRSTKLKESTDLWLMRSQFTFQKPVWQQFVPTFISSSLHNIGLPNGAYFYGN